SRRPPAPSLPSSITRLKCTAAAPAAPLRPLSTTSYPVKPIATSTGLPSIHERRVLSARRVRLKRCHGPMAGFSQPPRTSDEVIDRLADGELSPAEAFALFRE